MSRLAACLLIILVVVTSLLLLGGRVPVWRGTSDAGVSVAGGETGVVPKHVSGDPSASATEPSGADTGSDESSRRGDTRSMRDGVDPPEPGYQVLAGWPGLVEAELRFRGEGKDPRWSTPTENGLLTMISQLDALALSRLEADCRESMCRLLLVYPPGIEPIYTIRQIYERADGLGLGPVLAETRAEAGELRTLSVFLRRRPAASSRR